MFKRETANTLDILNGDDEDLDNLLFKTVNAQIKVSTTTNKTNTSTNQKNMLISQNAEFGDFFKNLQLLFDAIAILIRMRASNFFKFSSGISLASGDFEKRRV